MAFAPTRPTEFLPNNIHVPVPGLREIAELRRPPPRTASKWTKQIWQRDQHLMQARAAQAQADHATPPPAHWKVAIGAAPKCFGSCPLSCFSDLRYVNMTHASYQRSFLPDGARLWPPASETKGGAAQRLDSSANNCVAGDAPAWYKPFGALILDADKNE